MDAIDISNSTRIPMTLFVYTTHQDILIHHLIKAQKSRYKIIVIERDDSISRAFKEMMSYGPNELIPLIDSHPEECVRELAKKMIKDNLCFNDLIIELGV